MTSEVGIANSALTKLGVSKANHIVSLTEGSRNANYVNEQFAKLRDAELRAHTWSFAKERVQLAQISGTPVSGFDEHYQLPADFLRVDRVYDSDADIGMIKYEIKGDRLLSDSNQIFLIYVKRETDPNQFDALFAEVLAWRLAVELAIPIMGSGTMHDRMLRGYKSELRRARSADAIEDWPEEFPQSSWTASRHGRWSVWPR